MSHRVDRRRVRGLVEARLGRPVQDSFEAAVVLEAWGGVAGDSALSLGTEAGGADSGFRADEASRPPQRPAISHGVVSEGIALLLAVLAVAAWATPLSDAFGPSIWEQALTLALPLSFGLQWGIRCRYLSRDEWAPLMRADAVVLLVLCVAVTAGLVQFGKAGTIAALLAGTWLGGSILVRRGWALVYGLGLVGVSVLLHLDIPPEPLLGAMMGATLVAVLLAFRGADRELGAHGEPRPGGLADSVAAILAGGGIGVLLVGDDTVGWGVQGTAPALALVPSTIGSFWGGHHLWGIHIAVPRSLEGVPLARGDSLSVRSHATVVLAGAVLRLLLATAALSLAVVFIGQWTSGTVATSLMIGFAAMGLGSLGVSLLITLGCKIRAVLIVAVAVAAELALSFAEPVTISGAGLILGGTAAAVLSLSLALRLFLRPGRTLATAMWIT